MKRLVLIDGTSLLYRAYHALPRLHASNGFPTGAILGVANMVRKLAELDDAPYFAVIFDSGRKSFRNELYEPYKAQRPEMPEELKVQLGPLKELLSALGIPVVEVPGVEADDVIATLATRAAADGFEVIIAASDKDLLQLVDEKIVVVDPKSWERYDRQAVMKQFGVSPAQLPDFLALVGDPVDNLPGVRGMGKKTTTRLLKRYGSLDNLLHHLDEVGGRMGEALRACQEEVTLWRELARLRRDLPLELSVEDLQRQPTDHKRLIELLKRLEFSSWLRELSALDAPSTGQGHYETIASLGTWQAWQKKLEEASCVAFHLEAQDGDPFTAVPSGIALSVQEGEAAFLSLGAFPSLPRFLANPRKQKIGHHLKSACHLLRNARAKLSGIVHDVQIQAFLLQGRENDLETLTRRYLGVHLDSSNSWRGSCQRADLCLRLHRQFWPKIAASRELRRLYEEIEIPLISVLARMERAGILLDVEQLRALSLELSNRLDELRREIFALAGMTFNLDSPKQLREILFAKLKLPALKKTATGQPSTSEKVLRQLAQEHEIARLMLEYRHLAKLKSTYVDKLPRLIHPKTGRLHTTFHQTVVITGRLSSSNPNLQNIPARGTWGRKIRRAFMAPPGHLLLSADYSQIELRIVAHFSGDEKLLEAFQKGQDIHRATAAELFGIAEDQVTAEQRQVAKAINFGIIYGISPIGLSEQLGLSREEAARYIERYFERHPRLKTFTESLIEKAHQRGYAETLFGRRIPLPDLSSPRPTRRKAAERLAINAPIQGTAAEIIKKAMIAVDRWLQETRRGQLLLQVHDELLLEVPRASISEVEAAVRRFMEEAVRLNVPLEVATAVAPHWDMEHSL